MQVYYYYYSIQDGCLLAEEISTGFNPGVNPLLNSMHQQYWNSCANENYEFVDTWPNTGATWINSPLNDQNLNDYCNGDGSLWNEGSGIETDNSGYISSWAKMWCSQAVCCQAAFNWYSSGESNIDNWGGVETFNGTNCVGFTGPIGEPGAQGISPINRGPRALKESIKNRLKKLAGIKNKKK